MAAAAPPSETTTATTTADASTGATAPSIPAASPTANPTAPTLTEFQVAMVILVQSALLAVPYSIGIAGLNAIFGARFPNTFLLALLQSILGFPLFLGGEAIKKMFEAHVPVVTQLSRYMAKHPVSDTAFRLIKMEPPIISGTAGMVAGTSLYKYLTSSPTPSPSAIITDSAPFQGAFLVGAAAAAYFSRVNRLAKNDPAAFNPTQKNGILAAKILGLTLFNLINLTNGQSPSEVFASTVILAMILILIAVLQNTRYVERKLYGIGPDATAPQTEGDYGMAAPLLLHDRNSGITANGTADYPPAGDSREPHQITTSRNGAAAVAAAARAGRALSMAVVTDPLSRVDTHPAAEDATPAPVDNNSATEDDESATTRPTRRPPQPVVVETLNTPATVTPIRSLEMTSPRNAGIPASAPAAATPGE